MAEDRRKHGPNRRLDSWKEIASYFGRDERTVKRWEKERGLPVRRLPGVRGRVYAFSDDLASWMDSRNSGPAPHENHKAAAATESTADYPRDDLPDQSPASQALPQPSRTPWSGAAQALAVTAIVFAVIVMVSIVFAGRNHLRPAIKDTSAPSIAVTRRAPDPKAESLYLEGRYYWNKRTPPDLHKALELFTQATVIDPNYAQAYVGLADCYNLLREYSAMPESEAYPKAMAAAQKAIDLDDSLADAHNSLAFGLFYWSLDPVRAEQEFRRALALNPNCDLAHHWYATFLMTVGRTREALDQIVTAQTLNASATSILADKGLILYYSGRTDDAIKLLKQIDQTEPSFLSTHRYLALINLMTGDYKGYLAEAKHVALLSKNSTELAIVNAATKGFQEKGPRGMLEAMLAEEKTFFAKGDIPAVRVAETYALLGHSHEALSYLQIARERRESALSGLLVDPELRNLRDDPSYRELISRVGLVPVTTS